MNDKFTDTDASLKPKPPLDEKITLGSDRSLWPILALVVVFVLAGGAIAGFSVFSNKPHYTPRIIDYNAELQRIANEPMNNTPMILPGLQQPPAYAIADLQAGEIADDDQVIGVTVGDHARAYKVATFGQGFGMRVVNDLIDDTPITLAYCDRKDLFQVMTLGEKGVLIDMYFGGWLDGESFLQYKDGQYKISQKMPCPLYPHTRTTWKSWRDEFPDTELYTGRGHKIPFAADEEETDINKLIEPKN